MNHKNFAAALLQRGKNLKEHCCLLAPVFYFRNKLRILLLKDFDQFYNAFANWALLELIIFA